MCTDRFVIPASAKLAGVAGVLSVILLLGHVGSSDAGPTHPAAASTPSPSGADSPERESIPVSCRELLADPPSSVPGHSPIAFTNATVLTMDAEGNRAGSVSVETAGS